MQKKHVIQAYYQKIDSIEKTCPTHNITFKKFVCHLYAPPCELSAPYQGGTSLNLKITTLNEINKNIDKYIVNKVTVSETGVFWVKPLINDRLDTGLSLTVTSYCDFVWRFGDKN